VTKVYFGREWAVMKGQREIALAMSICDTEVCQRSSATRFFNRSVLIRRSTVAGRRNVSSPNTVISLGNKGFRTDEDLKQVLFCLR